MKDGIRVKCSRAIVHLLVILFGVSTWIGVNGIFIELPLLVGTAPEGWNLPAYIVIVAQSANVGPAIYVLLLYKSKCQPDESSCILCLLGSQVLAMGLLIVFYDTTVAIGGEKHSLALLVTVFFSALVGCFSSVLFMPYLRDFDDVYIVSYFVGEGLSGVLPSVVALIQGVGEQAACDVPLANTTETINAPDLKFPGQYYFLFLTLVLVLSLVAFIVLRYSAFVQVNKSLRDPNFPTQTKVDYKRRSASDVTVHVYHIDNVDRTSADMPETANNCPLVKANSLALFRKVYLYVLIGVCCFFSNGFLPSIQSYSCLPYGHFAYQLSIVCAQFVNPLACFLTVWVMVSDIKIINCLSLACLIAGCYVTGVALLSPTPPLQKSTIGVGLIVLSWIVLMGIISYLKLVIVSVLKHMSSSKALFNVGVVMQTGSATGAIISFVLINFTDWFKAYNSCSV
ncbi:PREDICTED: solute carrier family 52, riboflavin transporter, member 3-A-like [Vollenhovia emeryi]|uniref:solute carrier family 52, riboflavin transporter, member 3-A-like n=1 Tax=Vollenhovia emeryi TaxID=411798 RepID=UPI0005F5807D|nr:PREDICTED: solute carrier family 52, riboflavin transporter, member 3-A-like [Vollenhovia emeryi]